MQEELPLLNNAARSYSATKLILKINKICISLLELCAITNVPTADGRAFPP
jgi:hypothetical protein